MEAALGSDGGPFFLGSEISLVDIVFVPFLERMVASIPYYKGLRLRGTGQWPNLEAWFAALELRPSYLGTKSDFYTHVHDLPPQLGGERTENTTPPPPLSLKRVTLPFLSSVSSIGTIRTLTKPVFSEFTEVLEFLGLLR